MFCKVMSEGIVKQSVRDQKFIARVFILPDKECFLPNSVLMIRKRLHQNRRAKEQLYSVNSLLISQAQPGVLGNPEPFKFRYMVFFPNLDIKINI